MYKVTDILFENDLGFCIVEQGAYRVYKTGVTHSTRVATVGLSLGVDRARDEFIRRFGQPITY